MITNRHTSTAARTVSHDFHATYAKGVFRWIDQRAIWFVIALTLLDMAHPPLPAYAWNAIYVLGIAIVAPTLARFAWRAVGAFRPHA